ncbi:MAG TPA: hypothetical protein VD816_12245, partial [Ohtaekwangia sp.]|nr:hypothetical protein [Ohtaekwangia sp.]
MEDYSFYERTPADAITDFELSLFNTPHYLFLGAPEGWITFYALHNRHQRIDALVHVHLTDGVARSPVKAPFGGVEYAGGVSPLILFQFLEFVESRLRSMGATSWTIKSPTFHYQESSLSLLHVFLLNRGFAVADAEVGCTIDLHEDFLKNIDTWEHRKLRQAEEAGVQFRTLPTVQLDEIYLFILACRKRKNYALSMTLQEVRQVVEQFPDRYLLCGCYLEG